MGYEATGIVQAFGSATTDFQPSGHVRTGSQSSVACASFVSEARTICAITGKSSQGHWMLEADFGENLDRKRSGHAAQNFFAAQLHRSESAQPGINLQTRNQGKKTQSRLVSPLPDQVSGNLICAGANSTVVLPSNDGKTAKSPGPKALQVCTFSAG
jgi:hypothetical protein